MARGKYAGVIDTLPRLLATEASYQDKVNIVKAEIIRKVRENTGMPPSGSFLAARYDEQREVKDKIEDELSAVNLELEAYSQLIVDQFEAEGVSNVRLDTGPMIGVQMEPYAQVENRDTCREWAISNGLERSLMLPWQTLNSISKEKLLKGEPPPDGVKIYAKAKIVRRVS